MKPMQGSRRSLISRCRALGLGLTDEGHKIEVFCPPGKRLAGPGVHFLTVSTAGWRRADLYMDLLHDLDLGLEDCDDDDCECRDEPGIPVDVPAGCVLVAM